MHDARYLDLDSALPTQTQDFMGGTSRRPLLARHLTDMHVHCSHASADDIHISSALAASPVERTGGKGSAEQGQRRGHKRSAGLVA